jgi:L-threonylcarbamoyladenylate synthase
MNTTIITINENNIDKEAIKLAASFIHAQQCVAMPTETVYGLAANAWSDEAILKIFEAKGRPSDNPLIVHVSDEAMLLKCIDQPLNQKIKKLMEAFWPGPLTMVFKKSSRISDLVSASLPTVGIRMPAHPIALALIQTANVPLAAPSANISGRPSPTKGSHVFDDLQGKISAIIMANQSQVGVESTVLDVSSEPFAILRKGGLSIERLREIDPDIIYDDALLDVNMSPKSPGQKYKHYAPSKPMTLIEGTLSQQLDYLKDISLQNTLLISVQEIIQNLSGPYMHSLGSYDDYEMALNGLFDILRESEHIPVISILVTSFLDEGLGATLNDRLRKAANEKIILK